jgi:transcriptional regulator with XRE-family HTH domain
MTLAEKIENGTQAAVQAVAALVELRRQRGLSQYDVADLMGVGQPSVSSLERSQSPTLAQIGRYGDALGVRVALSVVVGKTVLTSDVTGT